MIPNDAEVQYTDISVNTFYGSLEFIESEFAFNKPVVSNQPCQVYASNWNDLVILTETYKGKVRVPSSRKLDYVSAGDTAVPGYPGSPIKDVLMYGILTWKFWLDCLIRGTSDTHDVPISEQDMPIQIRQPELYRVDITRLNIDTGDKVYAYLWNNALAEFNDILDYVNSN